MSDMPLRLHALETMHMLRAEVAESAVPTEQASRGWKLVTREVVQSGKMGGCAQASQVPENHHRPVNPHPQVRTEHGAEFETDLFACVIEMVITSPPLYTLLGRMYHQLHQIPFFSPSHPSLKHLSLTPNS